MTFLWIGIGIAGAWLLYWVFSAIIGMTAPLEKTAPLYLKQQLKKNGIVSIPDECILELALGDNGHTSEQLVIEHSFQAHVDLPRALRGLVALVLATAAACLAGCGDECSSYSDFSCKEIQSATYNAYFYYPSGSEVYLGVANGLGQCGSMAHSFAASKDMSGSSEWSYICCMKAKGSECHEKHR